MWGRHSCLPSITTRGTQSAGRNACPTLTQPLAALQISQDLGRFAARQAKAIEEQKQCPLRVAAVQFAAELHYLAEKCSLMPHPLGKSGGTSHGPRLFAIEHSGQAWPTRQDAPPLDLRR